MESEEISKPAKPEILKRMFSMRQVVYATGLATAAAPVMSTYEMLVLDKTPLESIIARGEASGFVLLFSPLLEGARSWLFEKPFMKKEWRKQAYDNASLISLSFIVGTGMYAGSDFFTGQGFNFLEGMQDSFKALPTVFPIAILGGWCVDMFMNATGYDENFDRLDNAMGLSTRLKEKYQSSSQSFKKKACAGVMAASLALSTLGYVFLPPGHDEETMPSHETECIEYNISSGLEAALCD